MQPPPAAGTQHRALKMAAVASNFQALRSAKAVRATTSGTCPLIFLLPATTPPGFPLITRAYAEVAENANPTRCGRCE